MRIHFSNVNFSSRSGPNSFASRLAEELTSRGHDIVGWQDVYDAALIFIEPSTHIRDDARTIQRLDGIWFKPGEFHAKNRLIKKTYESCDHVIFQSEFDKNMSEHYWGIRPNTVIRNGIKMGPTNLTFSISKSPETRIFVCSANWHPQKRLSENVRLYRQVRTENDILLVMGSTPDTDLREDLSEMYLGSLSHDECLAVFDKADWMIHLAWLDHCPNVVVESLSRGCPVICAADGGTKELVAGGNGVILPEYNEYKFQLTDYDSPPRVNMEGFEIPEPPTIDTSRFDIKIAADRYEKVLKGEM